MSSTTWLWWCASDIASQTDLAAIWSLCAPSTVTWMLSVSTSKSSLGNPISAVSKNYALCLLTRPFTMFWDSLIQKSCKLKTSAAKSQIKTPSVCLLTEIYLIWASGKNSSILFRRKSHLNSVSSFLTLKIFGFLRELLWLRKKKLQTGACLTCGCWRHSWRTLCLKVVRLL